VIANGTHRGTNRSVDFEALSYYVIVASAGGMTPPVHRFPGGLLALIQHPKEHGAPPAWKPELMKVGRGRNISLGVPGQALLPHGYAGL